MAELSPGQMAATAHGLTQKLIDSRPDDVYLKQAWEAYLKDDLVNASKYWYLSKYYQEVTNVSAIRQETKLGRNGVYQQDLAKYRADERARLIQSGINLPDATFNMITEDAYLGGLSDTELDAKVLQANTGKIGGTTLENIQNLKEYGASFGIELTDAQLDGYSKDIFGGKTTIYDIKNKIREDSASAFPAYAQQIKNGTSLDSLASAYKTSMANLLEIDVNSITYNDPTLRKALQGVANGKGAEYAAPTPLWEFENQVRKDPRWQFTNNARNTVDALQYQVLKDWKLM
jgi:hypothetical protein